jgi:hypothetical protein
LRGLLCAFTPFAAATAAAAASAFTRSGFACLRGLALGFGWRCLLAFWLALRLGLAYGFLPDLLLPGSLRPRFSSLRLFGTPTFAGLACGPFAPFGALAAFPFTPFTPATGFACFALGL